MSARLAREDLPLADRLDTYLRQAHAVIHDLPLQATLERLLGVDGAAWILGEMTGHLHLGFLTPSGVKAELLSSVAHDCGFGESHAFFQSEIMAQELAWRAQRPEVPTAIFKAEALPRDGRIAGVEAFTPTVEAETARTWLNDGVGIHLGVGLAAPRSVQRALALCRSSGFLPPPFFQGQPLLNVANAITVVYVDGCMDGESLRWEFYHALGEPPLSAESCSDKAKAEG
jgi:hypothetical protein